MMRKAVFLDRDGVINIDKAYVHTKENFEFCEGVYEALRHFQSLGYLLIIVTNQSGIGRGYYSEEAFQTLSAWMKQELLHVNIVLDAIYHCPHAPEVGCECRKPKSGMFQKAIRDFDIDVSASWMIGDKETDSEAALGAGIQQTIVLGKRNVKSILDTINLIKN